MSNISFWFLFIYITMVLIYQAVIHHHVYHGYEDDYDDEEDMRIEPDERGILGEVKDSDGEEYYAVVIPKKDYDKAWERMKEDDKK